MKNDFSLPALLTPNSASYPDIALLKSIEKRVLWLATRIIHEANVIRPNPDKSKVGGHQASSASVVSILTALYFHHLRAGDRVSIKPHASPAFHAVQYLLGQLDRAYLPTLRQFKGLQAYPSRTKDPDTVDFSTGSVGLGAVAPIFAALVDKYADLHFGHKETTQRFIALVGDAELDEGNVWEAVADEAIRGAKLANVTIIVDLNRQSLDRVIPGIRVHMLHGLFQSAGWQVVDAKYGQRLQGAFALPGGTALRQRIDDMSNEEYQAMLRLPAPQARRWVIDHAPPDQRGDLNQALADVPENELMNLLGDLAGHDYHTLLNALDCADQETERPTVIFAYTIKGKGLPIAGDPLNHSALLSQSQIDTLRADLDIPPDDDWAAFPLDSPQAELCQVAAARLYPAAKDISNRPPLSAAAIPLTLEGQPPPSTSSQEAFGKTLVELSRLEGIAERLVTVSPDVSISTNLGGWINRMGVFATEEVPLYDGSPPQVLRWQPTPKGQHIELGISEMNLFLLLGQFGLSYELNGQHLLPIGTVYDPFVCRGLDSLIYSLYSASKFVFAGTPSGISLSPEGGAHQSSVTVSLGIELPNLRLYEPCFAKETEWCLLEALRQCCDREHGLSTYLRLSTKPIDQTLLEKALRRLGEDQLRDQVLLGGYRLFDPSLDRPDLGSGAPSVLIAVAGAMIPEALLAAHELYDEGVAAAVLNLTSADRLYADLQTTHRQAVRNFRSSGSLGHLEALILPHERRAPIITVLDGASHALSFLGGAFGQRVIPLGVDRFSQSGSRAALYEHEDIDAASIVNAALISLSQL